MRHQKKINHLGRKSAHRKAMLSNMAASLIIHKRIHTTVAKAKALRIFVEPLITKSKDDTTHSRRLVFSYIQSKEAVTELFREVSKKIMDRPGGYTRILKTGNRFGDNAEMCLIELVDYNEAMMAVKEEGKTKTSRRRRSSTNKKSDESTTKEKPEVAAKPQKTKTAETPKPEPEAKSENPIESSAKPDVPEDKPEV
ncbi:MAG: 50S ribosomal protein L17 [Bacteroidales bacterium]|nr:50S ribosomal protein L17 [Bacteroidales bacterium]